MSPAADREGSLMADRQELDHTSRRKLRREVRHELRHAVLTEHGLTHRERRRAQTQEEIMEAAREVFAESGALDFSLAEIARRLGFTPAALYKYFDSKDELVKALAQRALANLFEALSRVPPMLAPDERAVEMGMAYLEFARANPHDVALVALHESLQMTRAGGHAGLEEQVMGVFREGVERGVFKASSDHDVELMVYGAWSLVHGMAVLLERQPPQIAEHLRPAQQRQLLQAFVNGLKVDWSSQGSAPEGASS
jgi:AcrR family transcriptional regulator